MKYGLAAAAALTVLLAACSSSSSSSTVSSPSAKPSTMTGTETLTGTDVGSAAATFLNSNSNGPATFTEGVWTGPVAVTVKPFTLPGDSNNANKAATVTFTTPVGNLTVHHSANQVPGASNQNAPPPATWTRTGKTCYFLATFAKGTGTFLSGTGKFTGAHGTLTYVFTAQGYAPLKKGATTCTFTHVGSIEPTGAMVKFIATGPLTVKA